MDLPSVAAQTGTVGSRFVSQDEIDSATARRDEQWKAAYSRLGQEPPPRPVEDVFDGRSLAEKLAANKAAKQEEWEERNKLANQFRALEEDEIQFLEAIRSDEARKELKRKQEDADEVNGFKQAVAARNALPDKPPVGAGAGSAASDSNKTAAAAAAATDRASTGANPTAVKISPPMAKRLKQPGTKGGLKGVIVKKKSASSKPTLAKEKQKESEEDVSRESGVKKRRVSSPGS